MKTLNIVASGLVAVFMLMSMAGAALFAGAGSAGAVPDVVGRPYKDAKKMIQQAGGTPVIATRTGSAAEDGECLVANAWEAGYPRVSSRGRIIGNSEVLVALNCNGELAAPGSPGNSAGSPAGREAKAAQDDAADAEEAELAEPATPGA